MDQLTCLLAAGDLALSDETLDRIDEVVPPGHQRQPGRRRMGLASGVTGMASPASDGRPLNQSSICMPTVVVRSAGSPK